MVNPHTLLSIDSDAWTVTVPSRGGKTEHAVVEDVRPAFADDSFAALVREANDRLNCDIFDLTSDL